MKNRYYLFKRLYPIYLIVFIKNGKYTLFGVDKMLIPYMREISHVIVDKNNNVEIYDVKSNKYFDYVVKCDLKKFINYLLNN